MDDYLVSFYQNRHCKGLCTQADKTGMCMGICTVSDDFALECYVRFKANPPNNKPLEPIEFFEKKLGLTPSPNAAPTGDRTPSVPKGGR